MPPVSSRRFALALTAMLTAVAATAGPALATTRCPAAPLSNPFAPWADNADYQLAPGGDVEDAGASWSLAGGAAVQEGNETFQVGGSGDHLSLRLSGTSAATTERMCIGAEHTSFRFFVKRAGGSSLSRLLVDVVGDDPWGRARSLTVGAVSGSAAWAPSSQLPTVASIFAGLSDNSIDISFRFRAYGDAVWSIDDLYVDPARSH